MKPLFETRTYDTENAKSGVIFFYILAFKTIVAGRTGKPNLEQDRDVLELRNKPKTSNTTETGTKE